MATLGEKLDLWEAGQLSDVGQQKLINRVMSGTLDDLGQSEGIDMEALRSYMQKKTGAGSISVGQTPVSAPIERGVQEQTIGQKIAEKLPEKSGIAQAAQDGSKMPVLEGMVTQNPLVQMGIGAVKGATETATGIGGKIEEFLGIEPIADKIEDPEVKAEYDRLSTEFEDTIQREGFGQKAGKTLFDLAAIYAASRLGAAPFGASAAGANAPALAGLSFLGESAAGTAGATAVMEQEAPTAGELGIGLLADKAISSITKIPGSGKRLIEWSQNILKGGDDILTRAGLDAPQANVIKDIPDNLKPFAEEALEQAKLRSEKIFQFGGTGGKVKTATDLVADNIKATQSSLKGQLKTVGEEIGVVSKGLGSKGNVSTRPALESFLSDLDALNIGVEGKNLNFDVSDVEGISADKALLQDAYDFLRGQGTANPRDLLAKIRNYGNKLFAGRGEITASKRPIAALRENLLAALGEADPAYKPLAEQYSKLMDATDTLNSTVRESGEQAYSYVNRLFSRASGKAENVMALIEELAKEFDIPQAKDISGKAIIATTMDALGGIKPPQGFSGQIAEAGKEIADKGLIRGAVDTLVNAIVDSPTKLEAVEQLIKNIESPKAPFAQGVDSALNVIEDENLRELLISIRSAIQSEVKQ